MTSTSSRSRLAFGPLAVASLLACQEAPKVLLLTQANPSSLELDGRYADDGGLQSLSVRLPYATAEGCPSLDQTLAATLNGKALTLVSKGGTVQSGNRSSCSQAATWEATSDRKSVV